MHRYLWTALLGAVALGVVTLGLVGAAGARDGSGYEVWAVDQSNTNGTTSGGTIHVYDGREPRRAGRVRRSGRSGSTSAAAVALCIAQTGTAPVRPHMLFFNAAESHAVLAFVASGHVLFLDADERTPLACIDVGVQAHAAVPAPDESYVVVANQNGKLLQRISTDYATNTFTLEPGATLDLANGTTPTGALRQDPVLRPDNAPICPLIDSTSRLDVRDAARRRPLRRRQPGDADADRRRVRPARRSTATAAAASRRTGRCTSTRAAARPRTCPSSTSTRSRWRTSDCPRPLLCAFEQPNTPAPKLVVSQDDREHTDAHGVTLTKHGRYLWVADRVGNRIVVIETETDQVVNE